jgi:NADH:ubiquinone oxidoreductase subunit 6 (subunit J)
MNLVSTARLIGEMLMTAYALPFEVASIILLVAMVGAALIARRPKKLS